MSTANLQQIYERLFAAYGPQHWWPAEGPFEMIVGAILVQNTAWTNASKAIAQLKAADRLSPTGLLALPEFDLAEQIRSSGFYNAKARKLKAFVTHLAENYDNRLEDLLARETLALRQELLGIHGIGPETADSIVLYGAGRPIFVIDAYTRRLFTRLGLLDRPTYDDAQRYCHAHLPADAALFNEYHALIVRHSVVHCRARPICVECPLASVCDQIVDSRA